MVANPVKRYPLYLDNLDMVATMDDTLMGLRELDSHLDLFDASLGQDSSNSDSLSISTAHPTHTIIVESSDTRFPTRKYQSDVGAHSRKLVFGNITQ